MKKEQTKQKITIEVEPTQAVVTIGLLRGFFPSIMAQINENELIRSQNLHFSNIDEMQEVLDEIYEKCIAQTTIREGVAGLIEILKHRGPFQDDSLN